MSVRRNISVLLAGGLFALLLAGCSRDNTVTAIAETDDPGYREGQQLLRQGRTQEALSAYLKVIEKRGEQASAESHLEVGIILMQHIHDPLEAIHHFRKYLEQQPNSHQAPLVKEQMENAKREFAKTLPGQPLESQSGRLDTLEQLDSLKRENQLLRSELAATRTSGDLNRPLNSIRVPLNEPATSRSAPAPEEISPIIPAPLNLRELSPSPIASTPPSSAQTTAPTAVGPRGSRPLSKPTAPASPVAPTGTSRTYKVGTKETLWAVATKAYGSATNARVTAIVDANRDLLPNGGASLKAGMVLRIP